MDDDTCYSDLLRSLVANSPKSAKKLADINLPSALSPVRVSKSSDLVKQLNKLSLLKKRDELVAARQRALDQLNENKRLSRRLTQDKDKLVAERMLETLLQQNAHQFSAKVDEKLRPEIDDSVHLSSIDVLPSQDWSTRLQEIRRFLPHVYLTHASVLTKNFAVAPSRVYSFQINCPGVFRIPVEVLVTVNQSLISNISIPTRKLRTIATLLNLFYLSLFLYLETVSVHQIIRGLNSLAMQVKLRVDNYLDVFETFRRFVVPDFVIQKVVSDPTLVEGDGKYSSLKTLDEMVLKVEKCKVVIRWSIVVVDEITGECDLEILVKLLKGDNVDDITGLIQRLSRDNSVVDCLCIIFKRVFDIDV